MKSISLFTKLCFCILLIGTAITSCKENEAPEKMTLDFGNITFFASAGGPVSQTFARVTTNSLATDSTTMDSTTTGGSTPDDSVSDSVASDYNSPTVQVKWSAASIYVEKISFVSKTNTLLDTTIRVEKNMNIFNEDAFVGIVKLPPGSYKDVEVKMFCRKSMKSEMAFSFSGTFTNIMGIQDSVIVGSSYPFEAGLAITDIEIDASDNYKATFSFDLTKVLTGISASMLETVGYRIYNGKKRYGIWKGGSADEPFYDQVIENWQNVGSVTISKE